MNQKVKKDLLDRIMKFGRITGPTMKNFGFKEEYSQGKLLKELRTELEVPQKDIAEKIGVTQPTLSAHERKQTVNVVTLDKYLESLGLEHEAFLLLLRILSSLNIDLNTLLSMDDKDLEEKTRELVIVNSREARQVLIDRLLKDVSIMVVSDLYKVIDYAEMINDQNLYRKIRNVPAAKWESVKEGE